MQQDGQGSARWDLTTEVLGVPKENIPRRVLGMKSGPEQAPERGDEGVQTTPSLSAPKGVEKPGSSKKRMGAEQGSWSIKARAVETVSRLAGRASKGERGGSGRRGGDKERGPGRGERERGPKAAVTDSVRRVCTGHGLEGDSRTGRPPPGSRGGLVQVGFSRTLGCHML